MNMQNRIAVFIVGSFVSLTVAGAAPLRTTMLLDGAWQVAEGSLTNMPATFDRTAPVPGLVDMAMPAFTNAAAKGVAPGTFWYRRSFVLPDPLPVVGILRVGQSQYGIAVFVNGQPPRERVSGFVPMQFDVRKYLKPGANEIVIRVSSFPTMPPGNYMPAKYQIGWDAEKVAYTPGISDSVELILSGTPRIENVQVAPVIGKQWAEIRVHLDGSAEPPVEIEIREAKSGKLAGRQTGRADAGTKVLQLVVPITDCRLWSPENPFLYTLTARTAGDEFTTRFGMREFRFDPQTGHAVLNGKPYFMRGSNVCIYRFFDDPDRGGLPWDADWVRRLHRKFKDMHWNSLRYCIGFPPQRWYDVADEEGIMIQDEYPIWNPNRLFSETVDALADEYRAMMENHWNHPSVVIWDSCNETRNTITGQARDRVRDLDLSNRPWENGWARSDRPTDVVEDHPYHYLFTANPNPRLPLLKTANPGAGGQAPAWRPGHSPVLVNEYGGLWLNRDGTPTYLTRQLYARMLGANATTEQRRHTHALLLAADTEFFRAHRRLAGVLEFCALSYSRSSNRTGDPLSEYAKLRPPGALGNGTDGATCDHWTEHGVAKLEWDPEFYRYVRDAFAPVGLMVGFWDESATAGAVEKIPVTLINDLGEPWNGPVTLRVRRGDRVIAEQKQGSRIAAFATTSIPFEVIWPIQVGLCTLEAELRGADGQAVRSVRELTLQASPTAR
jgi:beta-galactosidase